MTIKRSIKTPIQNRIVETGNLVFVGGFHRGRHRDHGPADREHPRQDRGYLREVGLDRKASIAAQIFVTDLSQKKEMDAAPDRLLRR